MNKSLVITTAGTNRPRPAGVAVVARADMVRVEELAACFMVDATVMDMSHSTGVGIHEVTDTPRARASEGL